MVQVTAFCPYGEHLKHQYLALTIMNIKNISSLSCLYKLWDALIKGCCLKCQLNCQLPAVVTTDRHKNFNLEVSKSCVAMVQGS